MTDQTNPKSTRTEDVVNYQAKWVVVLLGTNSERSITRRFQPSGEVT